MNNTNSKDKILQIHLHKNSIEVYPLKSSPKTGYKEWELKDLNYFLEEFITYFFLKKEVTLITIKNSFSVFFEEFKGKTPITITKKRRFFVWEQTKEYVAFYLSYTTCTNSFIRMMLSEQEWWMDNICLTSLTKKDEMLLKTILEKDLQESSDITIFSSKTCELIPNFLMPIGDGYGFIFFNPTEGLENALSKIQELGSKWEFKIKID